MCLPYCIQCPISHDVFLHSAWILYLDYFVFMYKHFIIQCIRCWEMWCKNCSITLLFHLHHANACFMWGTWEKKCYTAVRPEAKSHGNIWSNVHCVLQCSRPHRECKLGMCIIINVQATQSSYACICITESGHIRRGSIPKWEHWIPWTTLSTTDQLCIWVIHKMLHKSLHTTMLVYIDGNRCEGDQILFILLSLSPRV